VGLLIDGDNEGEREGPDGKHEDWVEVERERNVNGVAQSERRDKNKSGGQIKFSLEFKGGGVEMFKSIEGRRRKRYKEKEWEEGDERGGERERCAILPNLYPLTIPLQLSDIEPGVQPEYMLWNTTRIGHPKLTLTIQEKLAGHMWGYWVGRGWNLVSENSMCQVAPKITAGIL